MGTGNAARSGRLRTVARVVGRGDYTQKVGSDLVFVLRVPVKERLNLDLRGMPDCPATLIEKQVHS